MKELLAARICKPAVVQTAGDRNWAIRARKHKDKIVLHFMNTALVGKPHATIRDKSDIPVLSSIESTNKDNALVIEVNTRIIPAASFRLASPELKEQHRLVTITQKSRDVAVLHIDLSGIKIYAVAQ